MKDKLVQQAKKLTTKNPLPWSWKRVGHGCDNSVWLLDVSGEPFASLSAGEEEVEEFAEVFVGQMNGLVEQVG